MKIILQPEARTISNRELRINQQDLINLFNRLNTFIPKLSKRSIDQNPQTNL